MQVVPEVGQVKVASADAGPVSNAAAAADSNKLCLFKFDPLHLERRPPLRGGNKPFAIRHSPFLESAQQIDRADPLDRIVAAAYQIETEVQRPAAGVRAKRRAEHDIALRRIGPLNDELLARDR